MSSDIAALTSSFFDEPDWLGSIVRFAAGPTDSGSSSLATIVPAASPFAVENDTDWDGLGRGRVAAAAARQAARTILEGYETYSTANWDLQGARPIASDTLRIAKDLIEALLSSWARWAPDAAPSSDGSIGFEWWNGKAHLFVDVGPAQEVYAYLKLGPGCVPVEEHFEWGDGALLPSLGALFARLQSASVIYTGSAWMSPESAGWAHVGSGKATRHLQGMFGFAPSQTLPTSSLDAFTTVPSEEPQLVLRFGHERLGNLRYRAV